MKIEKGIINKVFNLEKLIDYRTGAVVSKTLINKKVGTLTLFSFDKGQGLSTHKASFDAAVTILDGKAKIVVGKKKHALKKGDFLIMPANVPHSLTAVQKFKMLLIMIRE